MTELTIVRQHENKQFIRWTLNERAQHWIMAVSFLTLVITGFALKYPDAWWVRPFGGWNWTFNLRGLLHRFAGAIFVLLGFYHVFFMFATARGRALLKALLPQRRDLKDLSQNIAYNFGREKQPPQFGHFSYMEKAEYWALIWGAIIMSVSGLMLWFKDLTLLFLPRWSLDLLTVIHLYEAWLATLAIVVWHFYYVLFNPDTYPINTSMIDGNINEKEFRNEYFLEWQDLQEKENQKEIEVES